MKNAVFISSGIGNALLLVPLIKTLKVEGKVVAICTSPYQSEEIFDGFKDVLFDDKVILQSSIDWIKQPFAFNRKFDRVFMDPFAARRKNIVLAHSWSREIVTNTVPHRLPGIFSSKLRIVEPVVGVHEGTQYMRYVNESFADESLNEKLFALKATAQKVITHEDYITIQPGSGNNITPWKTYPLKNWNRLIEMLVESFPNKQIVILGDDSEISLKPQIFQHPSVIDAIGITALADLPGIISKSSLHLGNDSGLMHVAGCVGTPTVSVWGGSDPAMYGWHKINSKKHRLLHKPMACGPCSRWIEPNTSRVELPSMCPDFACMKSIRPEDILREVEQILST